MGIGSCEQLNRVADMFCWKYGISGEGKLHWTLGLKVKGNFSRHMVTLSQQSYIENLVDHIHHTTCPRDDSHQRPVPQDPCRSPGHGQ